MSTWLVPEQIIVDPVAPCARPAGSLDYRADTSMGKVTRHPPVPPPLARAFAAITNPPTAAALPKGS